VEKRRDEKEKNLHVMLGNLPFFRRRNWWLIIFVVVVVLCHRKTQAKFSFLSTTNQPNRESKKETKVESI
jgi:hypothetical protein